MYFAYTTGKMKFQLMKMKKTKGWGDCGNFLKEENSEVWHAD